MAQETASQELRRSCPQKIGEKKEERKLVTQLCPTLCDPPGSSVHGILQAGILEWVATKEHIYGFWLGKTCSQAHVLDKKNHCWSQKNKIAQGNSINACPTIHVKMLESGLMRIPPETCILQSRGPVFLKHSVSHAAFHPEFLSGSAVRQQLQPLLTSSSQSWVLSNTLYSSLFTKKSSKGVARARDLGFKVGRSERMCEQEPGPGEGGWQSCVRAHVLLGLPSHMKRGESDGPDSATGPLLRPLG